MERLNYKSAVTIFLSGCYPPHPEHFNDRQPQPNKLPKRCVLIRHNQCKKKINNDKQGGAS